MTVLSIQNLTKRYGAKNAVSNLTLNLERGQVYGLLGPNGSGKTTSLAIVLGVVQPTSGAYSWFMSGTAPGLRRKIGSILEQPNFYPWLTGRQNLLITAAIRQKGERDVDTVLEKVGLGARGGDRYGTYSLGMRQRLALAATLIGDPEVLVLDEPTNGVDAQGIAEIRNLIKETAQAGKTVLLASHILDEVEKTCTHVAVMKDGALIDSGAIHTVLGASSFVEVGGCTKDQVAAAIGTDPSVKSIDDANEIIRIEVTADFDVAGLNKRLVDAGFYPNHLIRRHRSLEAHFLELLKQ